MPEATHTPSGFLSHDTIIVHMNNPTYDSSSEDELIFNCLGTSIDEAYEGLDDEGSDDIPDHENMSD